MMRWGSLIALVVTALMACSDAGKSTYIKKKKDTFASNEYAEKQYKLKLN